MGSEGRRNGGKSLRFLAAACGSADAHPARGMRGGGEGALQGGPGRRRCSEEGGGLVGKREGEAGENRREEKRAMPEEGGKSEARRTGKKRVPYSSRHAGQKRRPAQATDAEIVRGGGPPEGFSQAARGTSCTLRCRFRPTRRSRACRDWRRTRRTVRARPRSRRPRGRIPRRGCGSGTWSR